LPSLSNVPRSRKGHSGFEGLMLSGQSGLCNWENS
jgi:hypothetical protein